MFWLFIIIIDSPFSAGVVGHCSDDNLGLSVGRQVPIAQRQSAEGDAVSPIPGDGGGGGDGSSGSERFVCFGSLFMSFPIFQLCLVDPCY